MLKNAFIACCLLAACTQDDVRREARKGSLIDQVDDLAKETIYFRDHAGICWGLVWAGSGHGGPAGGPVPGSIPGGPCPPVPPAETPTVPVAP